MNRLKIMVGGTLLFLTNQAYSQEKQSTVSSQINTSVENSPDTIPDYIFCYVKEEMPEFPGGQFAVMDFIKENYVLPKGITKEEVESCRRITVSFCISESGEVVEPIIVRGCSPALDSSAVAVVKKMPRWKPGKVAGKNARVMYTVPINISNFINKTE